MEMTEKEKIEEQIKHRLSKIYHVGEPLSRNERWKNVAHEVQRMITEAREQTRKEIMNVSMN